MGLCCRGQVLNTDGHAHLKPVGYVPRDGDGLMLEISRVVTHYNTDSLTGRQDLSKLKEVVYINEEDIKMLGISDGAMVRVTSHCGEVTVKAKVGQGG